MKTITSLIMIFFSWSHLQAQEITATQDEILSSCFECIDSVVDSKIYLNPDKIWFFQEKWYIQNNYQQWILLPIAPLSDANGQYLSAKEDKKCSNGHRAILRNKGIYYCAHRGCPYHFSNQ